jgi:ribosomal protein S18 acetylase RimI-like enzyme
MTLSNQSTIRLATAEDLPAAGQLFADYPYKTAQQLVQKLDRERLAGFYLASLQGALEKGWPHWIAEQNGKAVALAGLAPDPWHAEVYGLKMGKIGPWLNTRQPDLGRDLLNEVERLARQQDYEHLSVRLDGEDFPNLQLFEANGWRLVDVSLKFSLPLPILPIHERRPDAPAKSSAEASAKASAEVSGWTIDQARPEDGEWIRRIGSQTHAGTHFLNDPALPRDKTRELFARWLDRCLDRLAYRIDTLRDAQGQGRGFVTYLRNQGFARAVGRAPLILDFVLLDPAVRGAGWGPRLIEESLAREGRSGFDYCELRTSAHNLPAVNCYEKLGFRCCATDFVLHKTMSKTR